MVLTLALRHWDLQRRKSGGQNVMQQHSEQQHVNTRAQFRPFVDCGAGRSMSEHGPRCCAVDAVYSGLLAICAAIDSRTMVPNSWQPPSAIQHCHKIPKSSYEILQTFVFDLDVELPEDIHIAQVVQQLIFVGRNTYEPMMIPSIPSVFRTLRNGDS